MRLRSTCCKYHKKCRSRLKLCSSCNQVIGKTAVELLTGLFLIKQVIGKASVLDEIINYIQALQRQVEVYIYC